MCWIRSAPHEDATRCLGLVIAFGLACSRTIDGEDPNHEEDPNYQERIDVYVAHHCSVDVECGNIAPCTTYDECFEDISTQSFAWEGDDQCLDSRWEYYDCRAKVTSCEMWPVGAGLGHECHAAWEDNFLDCQR